MKIKKIAIVGAGGFGREVAMLIDQINQCEFEYEIVGYYDDQKDVGDIINGVPVLGCVSDINKVKENLNIVLAIGDPKTKAIIIESIGNENVFYSTLIHPGVSIGNEVEIGIGTIITTGCTITENIIIGNHVILNLHCTVGHDAVISDYCSFMPSVNISGETFFDELVYVGTGATIINQKRIGRESIIGAGAVIVKDVPDGVTVVGNPGRVI